MSIAVGYVDTLMPYPFCDCQSGKSHVNQQANMAVSQIMYANAFYPSFFTAYRNRRADAVAAIWPIIDWKVVEQRYEKK